MIVIKTRNRRISVLDFFIKSVYFFTSILSIFICMCGYNDIKAYESIFILPFIFLIFSMLLLSLNNSKKNGHITVAILCFLQWLRMVLLPMLGTVSGYFSEIGTNINESVIPLAIALIVYESIITFLISIFIIYNTKENKTSIENLNVDLLGNVKIYYIFILVALLLFIKNGANQYHFFALTLEEQRLSTTIGTDGSAINAVIDYGLTFLVIILFYYCYRKYNMNNNNIYMYLALLIAGLRICLISSEGRMNQIYLLGTFLLILPQLFPRFAKKIKNYIIIVSLCVIGLLTIYKTFHAFLYESYAEAIQRSQFDLKDASSQIDVYFYGIKTIARNLTYCKSESLNISQCLLDLLRNTFGIHYLFKGQYSTLEYYNLFLYSGRASSGHLFSSLAYGYMYFGSILAPIVSCLNLLISFQFEKLLVKFKHLDVYYILGILFTRIVMSMFSNFSQTWNLVSRTIVIGFIIIGGASLFKKKKR